MNRMTNEDCRTPEKILCAAIKYSGGVILGPNHANCLFMLAEIRGTHASRADDEQGFVTTTNRFVDRKEAYDIAEREGQLTGKNPSRQRILYSEFCKYAEGSIYGVSQKEQQSPK